MNLDEWKKIRMDEIETVYETLVPFNPTVLPPDATFERGVWLSLSPDTFPYDQATEIRSQLEGTGETCRYELKFYFWQGPMHILQSFQIDTDEQNTAMLSFLKSTNPTTRSKIIDALQTELAKLMSWIRKDSDSAYADWRLQEPKLKGKVNRVQVVIEELSEGISPP